MQTNEQEAFFMNKNQIVHQERKEYWRELIKQCDASGQTQQEWCQENKVCSASLSRWRNQIWREEEARQVAEHVVSNYKIYNRL